MSIELDQEPFECEAFPGMMFTISGDREAVHLCALEEKHLGEVEAQPIIGIDRRGHLIRHPFRSFPLLPASTDGRISITSSRPTAPQAQPRATNPIIDHPALSAGIGLFSDGEAIRVFAQADGTQIPLVSVGANGKIKRFQLSSREIRIGRDMGLRFSEDSAIAIHNPARIATSTSESPSRSPNVYLAGADAEGWRAYDGSGMPVSAETMVQISTSHDPQESIRQDAMIAREWNWAAGTSIRLYRIVGEAQPQEAEADDADTTSLAFPGGSSTLTAAKLLRISYHKSVEFFEANEEALNDIASKVAEMGDHIDNGTEERRHFQRMIEKLDRAIEVMEREIETEAEAEDSPEEEDFDLPEDDVDPETEF